MSSEPRVRRPRWARYAILAAGWAFVLLGFIGLFLPILQGILFLAIGAWLLSMESPRVKRVVDRMRERYPILDKAMNAAQLRAMSISRRIRKR